MLGLEDLGYGFFDKMYLFRQELAGKNETQLIDIFERESKGVFEKPHAIVPVTTTKRHYEKSSEFFEESNYQAYQEILPDYSGTEKEHQYHIWIAIPLDSDDFQTFLDDIFRPLQDYPLLDDEKLSNLEHDYMSDIIEDCLKDNRWTIQSICSMQWDKVLDTVRSKHCEYGVDEFVIGCEDIITILWHENPTSISLSSLYSEYENNFQVSHFWKDNPLQDKLNAYHVGFEMTDKARELSNEINDKLIFSHWIGLKCYSDTRPARPVMRQVRALIVGNFAIHRTNWIYWGITYVGPDFQHHGMSVTKRIDVSLFTLDDVLTFITALENIIIEHDSVAKYAIQVNDLIERFYAGYITSERNST